MLRKIQLGVGALAVFIMFIMTVAPAMAGMRFTERKQPVPNMTVSLQVVGGLEHIFFMFNGVEKVVVVEEGSEPFYADWTTFTEKFAEIYPYAPEASYFRMKRETETPVVHIKLYQYDLLAGKASEEPYAVGSGKFMKEAMNVTRDSICLFDKSRCK